MSRVVLAMSGGVDSSVAASLLLDEGHEVIGLFMRHGHTVEDACETEAPGKSLPIVASGHKQGCCSAADAMDARRVADRLEIPFYALNFEREFGRIMDYFVEEYTAGRTPNPCVVCNNWLKFGSLCDYADSVGADYVATGHYARLRPDEAGAPALLKGRDDSKDQSYVLFGVRRELLTQMLFPVGEYEKPEIRARARELGLRVAEKRDSQEICFVTSGDYADFVRRRRGEAETSGEIVTTEGQVVGAHGGIENFTIGQRKGLGVALGEPRYVVRLEPEARRVVIGERRELARRRFTANRENWLADRPREPLRCELKIRYLSRPAPGRVTPLDEGRFQVELDEPATGVAPGQAAVCYAGDRVLGGGWIE